MSSLGVPAKRPVPTKPGHTPSKSTLGEALSAVILIVSQPTWEAIESAFFFVLPLLDEYKIIVFICLRNLYAILCTFKVLKTTISVYFVA